MTGLERWHLAQRAEGEYWAGLAANDDEIRHVLAANRELADRIEAWVKSVPDSALEIGIGGLGIGTLGFLQRFPLRIGLDPLPLPALSCGAELRHTLASLRHCVHLVTAHGECTPFAGASFELVLCNNVLDHVHDPRAVIAEVWRVLRPSGQLYLEVDVFSLLGLAKWHLWTRHRRKAELLVRAHPQRFREGHVIRHLKELGFEVLRRNEQSFKARVFGHSWRAAILARKPAA